MSQDAQNGQPLLDPEEGTTRRNFLKAAAITSAGVGAVAVSLAPLRDLDATFDKEAWLQKHYHELTPAEMDKVLAAWAPPVAALMLTLGMLLHAEDG